MIYNIDNNRFQLSLSDELDVIKDEEIHHLRYIKRVNTYCSGCFFYNHQESCDRFDCVEGLYVETPYPIEPLLECKTETKRKKHK